MLSQRAVPSARKATAKFVKFQRPTDFDGKLKTLLQHAEELRSSLNNTGGDSDDMKKPFHQLTVTTLRGDNVETYIIFFH